MEEHKKILATPEPVHTDVLTSVDMHVATSERIYEIGREFTQGFEFLASYPKSVTFFGSTQFKEDHPYYIQARNLAQKIVHELGYAVITGGGPGIMEAANRGAQEAGGKSIGLTIRLPKEQVMNQYMTNHVDFYYFFSRKVCLTYSAEAFIYCPGGYGTMDEFFEIITLLQTRKIPQVPVILVGKEYWTKIIDFLKDSLLSLATISEEDLSLFHIVDSDDEVISIIRNAKVRESVPYKGLKVNPVEPSVDLPLYQKHCVPCEGGTPPFTPAKNTEYLKRVNEWIMVDDVSIEKILLFKDFNEAMAFMNRVAVIAEAEGHHPDMTLFGWNKLKISLSTHAISGLSENDFVLASKIDQIRL